MYNMLIVDVQRCTNLDKLINDNYTPTTLISYELYDCDVWRSEPVSNNINPEYNSVKTWILPTGIDLYNTLRSSHLEIFVLEERMSGSGDERQIGYVNIALYPLVHNNEISGTFPLLSMISDTPTEASIDISIRWKFPYHPPESELNLIDADENLKQTAKTINILPEAKLVNNWPKVSNNFNDNNESESEKKIDGKIYDLEGLSRKSHHNESQNESSNMKSKEQSSIGNNQFIATNEYFEADNFRFHLDSKNNMDEVKPKAIDIVDDMEIDRNDKLDILQNQPVNTEEQHKSSILSRRKRKIPHVVEFADPIQQSFSPSTSSMDETTSSWTADEGQMIEDDIPIINAKLHEEIPFINDANTNKSPPNSAYTMELIIGSLRISELSKLIDPLYDNQSICIEWKFLDFPLEECETIGEPLPLPRDTQNTADFNFQKSYTLSNRQFQLLHQWIEHGN
uniref:C2 domain-containing protein n=1 Tax=Elaeophora elaphi TaxID=1147741 RepID=A0A0R3RMP3_9BILA